MNELSFQIADGEPAFSADRATELFGRALEKSRVMVLTIDDDDRLTSLFNPLPAFAAARALGRRIADILPSEAATALVSAHRDVLASRTPQDLELEILDGRVGRWIDLSLRPLGGGDGAREETTGLAHGAAPARATVACCIDITDRKVQEEHLRIVLRELAHRSKNLLSVIQGIARRTSETSASTEHFVSRLNGRIYSLSRAHDILTEADWRGARIFDLVRSQIALFAETRLSDLTIEGENGFLRPNAAQYIGLALHELTTNAVKYGAFSRPGGKLLVRFVDAPDDPDAFVLTWSESAGPPTRAPKGRSFGLQMIEKVVPTAVGGAAQLGFGPDGIRYDLTVNRSQLVI